MTTLKNPKAIALVATVLCLASIVWLMSTHSVNRSLETSLEQEKLKSESLLSEKLLLEKDIEKIKSQLSSLKGINSELDDVVKNAEIRFASQETEMKKLRKQNGSLAQVKKQREELLRLQQELEGQLFALQNSYRELENQNQTLNQTVANLQEQNRLLSNDLKRAMFAAVDHAQVQAVKGKREKLTVKARRTQKLIADFEVPASLNNITYRILDSKGNLLSNAQGTIVSSATASDENIIASTSDAAVGNGLKKVRMEYTPKVKMNSGVYTVEILNDNLYVGSLNVKLR